MYSEHRKLMNYRIFLYLNERKNGADFVFSIKKLEKYCDVPCYTIMHLLNLRRLMTDDNCEKVAECLSEKFGFNRKRRLTKDEISDKELYNIFKS